MPAHSVATPTNIAGLPRVTGVQITSDNINSFIPPLTSARLAQILYSTAQSQTNVTGISATGTASHNLRGTATFVAATSVAVVFGVAEANASYFVALGGNLAGYCWVTSKGTSGFTINCSVSNSNATDWILIR